MRTVRGNIPAFSIPTVRNGALVSQGRALTSSFSPCLPLRPPRDLPFEYVPSGGSIGLDPARRPIVVRAAGTVHECSSLLQYTLRTTLACAPAAATARSDDANAASVDRPLHSSVPPLLLRAWAVLRYASNNDFPPVNAHALHAGCTGPLGLSSGASCAPRRGLCSSPFPPSADLPSQLLSCPAVVASHHSVPDTAAHASCSSVHDPAPHGPLGFSLGVECVTLGGVWPSPFPPSAVLPLQFSLVSCNGCVASQCT